jgi:DNA-binding MarR family transcriptional regulator
MPSRPPRATSPRRLDAVAPDRRGAAEAPALTRLLGFRISVLGQLLYRGAEVMYGRDLGLSVRQWRVIAVVAHHGGLSANEVVRRTRLDKSQVSRAVAELVAKGLLRQAPDALDKRRSVLTLTRSGGRAVRQATPLANDRQRRLVAGVPPEDLQVFDRVLERLTRRAEDHLLELQGREPSAAEPRGGSDGR